MYTRQPYSAYASLPPMGVNGKPAKVKKQIPNWAFWTLVIVAIVLAIIIGVLWYYLQENRNAIFDGTACHYPTIQPLTCCPVDSSGNALPTCTSACQTNGDCPGYAPNCTNNVCST